MVSNMLLRPPALEKQFLISPPASPPEGWAPVEEAQPVLNIDLQSALAKLIPGSTHELHAATESQPGIVVHICPDTTTEDNCHGDEFVQPKPKIKIAQTPCPPSMSSQRNWNENENEKAHTPLDRHAETQKHTKIEYG